MVNTRLGPTARESRHITSLSLERQLVLRTLRASGSHIRVRDLVDELGLHENTVREHLEGLVASAHAERISVTSTGRGRPSYGYRARVDFLAHIAPQAREYASLALVLARRLAELGFDGAKVAISAGEEWAQVFNSLSATPATNKLAARKRVMDILESLGFSPQSSAKRNLIHLKSCPLLAAARLEPEIICSVHLGLVRGLIRQSGENPDDVELAQFAKLGSCRLSLP